MSAPNKATPTPDVNVAGMKAGDASVEVTPKQGGGLTLSPLPVGGRRRKSAKASKKAGRRKSKKAGRRTRRR